MSPQKRSLWKHRRRRRGGEQLPLGSYPGKSGTFPGKVENIRDLFYFLKITLFLWEKRRKF